jgi:tetratricopeptide (TPR) repeat protein
MQVELAKVHDGQPQQAPAAKAAGASSPPAQPVPQAGPLLPGSSSALQTIREIGQLMAQRKYADAIARLNGVLAAEPNNEEARRIRVAALILTARYAEARTDIDEVLKLKPDDKRMLSDRAIASLGMRQPDQALIDADRAVSADPNNALVYLNRGMIKRLSGKFQDAIGDYDRSISINSKEANAYGERGQAYMSVTQLDKALVDFDQALSLNPASDVARAARGLALLMKGNSAEGLVDIKNALDRNPNNQMAELGQGLAMLVSGQYDRAIVALNQIVGKSAAYDGLARTLRARAYLAKNDTADAMTDLNSVLATRPNDADALGLRGLAYSKTREYDKALDDLSKAIVQRETVERYFARATIYEAQNNFEKATNDYRSATQLAPRNVFDILAQAQAKQKIQQLSKKIPCGNSARKDETCL